MSSAIYAIQAKQKRHIKLAAARSLMSTRMPLHRLLPTKRIELSVESVEYLRLIFFLSKSKGRGNIVQLNSFLMLLQKMFSKWPKDSVSEESIKSVIIEIIRGLKYVRGDKLLSWSELLELIAKETKLLILPDVVMSNDLTKNETSSTSISSVEDYRHLLSVTAGLSYPKTAAVPSPDDGVLRPLIAQQPKYVSIFESHPSALRVKERLTDENRVYTREAARVGIRTTYGATLADDGQNFAMDTEEQPAEDIITTALPVVDLASCRFDDITDKEIAGVLDIFRGPASEEVMVEKFGFPMTRAKLRCLRPGTWLNDEVVNFYMNMLQQRDAALCSDDSKRKQSHFFNSFFMEKLLCTPGGYNYGNIKRWSKKFDVFSLEKVYFPINIRNTHWTMAIVHMRNRHIFYYDSMSGGGNRYLDALLRWLVDEAREKKGTTLDTSVWTLTDRKPCPQQLNGFDCGMFTIMAADFASDDLAFSYSQEHMTLFRRRICADILRGSLNYPIK